MCKVKHLFWQFGELSRFCSVICTKIVRWIVPFPFGEMYQNRSVKCSGGSSACCSTGHFAFALWRCAGALGLEPGCGLACGRVKLGRLAFNIWMLKWLIRASLPNCLMQSVLRNVAFYVAKHAVLACETARFGSQNVPFRKPISPLRDNGGHRHGFSCVCATIAVCRRANC